MLTNSNNDNILPILSAAGGVVLRNNNLLFIKKKMNWEFPKGKLDVGETFSQCAIRETSEETGLKENYLEIIKFIGTTNYIKEYDGISYNKFIHWYQMSYSNNNYDLLIPDTKEEISDCRWISIKDINKISIRDHMVDFVKEIYENPSSKLEI